MTTKTLQIAQLKPIANHLPFTLIGGLNVLESESLVDQVADHFVTVCHDLAVPFIFKASFDKANRSSLASFRGPGLEQGLKWLAEIKARYSVPIITDIHEVWQAEPVAEVADILQIPAFLCRQTDLIQAAAKTGRAIHLKKPQFLAPEDMTHVILKCEEAGNQRILVGERGTCFGYHNLVVDFLGFSLLKERGYPLVFDVTHSLQRPGGKGFAADGRRAQIAELARAGVSQGIAALFIEAHPNPDQAKCDGPCALPLNCLKPLLEQLQTLDQLIKSFTPLDTR